MNAVRLLILLMTTHQHPTVVLLDLGEASTASLQIISMFRFFGLDSHENPPENFQSSISRYGLLDVCSWVGVSCSNGCVESLGYVYDKRMPQMHVAWAPRSTRMCSLYGQRVSAPNLTRCLPPRLENLCVVACGVHGTLDLTCLPRNMVTVDLEKNMLSGVVSLMHLPATLKRLNLRTNRISTVIGTASCLPPGISRVDISAQGMFAATYVSCDGSEKPPIFKI